MQAWAAATTQPTAACQATRGSAGGPAGRPPPRQHGMLACLGASCFLAAQACLLAAHAPAFTQHFRCRAATAEPSRPHRPPAGRRRYTFDDSHVSEMNASGVQTRAAYVLFYKRQGAEADLQALLEQHRQQQHQEAADSGRGVGAAPSSPAIGTPASPGAGIAAAPPPPPPLPGAPGGGGTTLGKRQPEMASIGEEMEDGVDEAAVAGPFEIDYI